MEILYLLDGEIKHSETVDDVPEDASFTWYDFQEFDEEAAKLNIVRRDLEALESFSYLPKYIDYGDSELFVCHLINDDLTPTPVNVILTDNKCITYHNGSMNTLINKKEIIRRGEINPSEAALIILEQSIKHYFSAVYNVEEEVLSLEDKEGADRRRKDFMDQVFEIRSRLLKVKRIIVPTSEMIVYMKTEGHFKKTAREKSKLKHIDMMLRRQLNVLKSIDDMTDEIRDNYTSYNAYKTNRVMTILTLISAIFLPLTLITGIYGMNFNNMPELQFHYGYYIVLGVMSVISIFMLSYFKIKKWM